MNIRSKWSSVAEARDIGEAQMNSGGKMVSIRTKFRARQFLLKMIFTVAKNEKNRPIIIEDIAFKVS